MVNAALAKGMDDAVDEVHDSVDQLEAENAHFQERAEVAYEDPEAQKSKESHLHDKIDRPASENAATHAKIKIVTQEVENNKNMEKQ